MNRKKFFKEGLIQIFKAVKKSKEVQQIIPEKIKEVIVNNSNIKNTTEEISNLEPNYLKPKRQTFKNLKHPPGALREKKKFESKCTGCGDCITACPHDVILPLYVDRLNKSLPFMDLNFKACQMCIDYPCIQACKPKALKPFSKKEKPKFGQAKLIFENCLNYTEKNLNCTTCKDSCPVENVVSFSNTKPKFSRNCTGCGQCVMACPTFPKAIVIK